MDSADESQNLPSIARTCVYQDVELGSTNKKCWAASTSNNLMCLSKTDKASSYINFLQQILVEIFWPLR